MSNKVLITNSQKAVKIPSGRRIRIRRPDGIFTAF